MDDCHGDGLFVKAAHDITDIAGRGLDDETPPTFCATTSATTLVRGGTDLVIVAELLGYARLEPGAKPGRPPRTGPKPLDLLPTDE